LCVQIWIVRRYSAKRARQEPRAEGHKPSAKSREPRWKSERSSPWRSGTASDAHTSGNKSHHPGVIMPRDCNGRFTRRRRGARSDTTDVGREHSAHTSGATREDAPAQKTGHAEKREAAQQRGADVGAAPMPVDKQRKATLTLPRGSRTSQFTKMCLWAASPQHQRSTRGRPTPHA